MSVSVSVFVSSPLFATMNRAIEAVRQKFAQEVGKNPDLYHPVDVKRAETEDWQIERYLIDANNNDTELSDQDIENAFKNMIETFQMKKELKTHDIDWSYFPTEFYQFYYLELYGKDKEGLPILWEALRNQRMFTEYGTIFKQLIMFMLEQTDRKAGKNGFIYCCDHNQVGLENVDLGLTRFRIDNVCKYFPQSIKKVIMIDVPFLIKPFIRLAVTFMNDYVRNAVRYCNKDQLAGMIDADIIPKALGGQRTERHYPKEAKSLRDIYEHLGLTTKDVDTYFNYYKNKMHLIEY